MMGEICGSGSCVVPKEGSRFDCISTRLCQLSVRLSITGVDVVDADLACGFEESLKFRKKVQDSGCNAQCVQKFCGDSA